MSWHPELSILSQGGIIDTGGHVLSAGSAHVIRLPDGEAMRTALQPGATIVANGFRAYRVNEVKPAPQPGWLVARCSA